MAVRFVPAPGVKQIADQLIRNHHSHLAQAKIEYVFREGGTWKAKGSVRLGAAAKEDGKHRLLTGADFVIVINRDEWVTLSEQQRRALVDHELCHCRQAVDAEGELKTDDDGRPVWTVVSHDVEEFAEIIERYGLWRQNLKTFGKAVRQAEQQLDIDDLARQEAAAASGGDIVGKVVARIPEAVREAARTDPRLRGVSVEVLPAREREEATVT